MNKYIVRYVAPAVVLSGAFVAADILLDRWIATPLTLYLTHFVGAAAIILIALGSLSRAVETHRRTEATLREARDELESRARERASELQRKDQRLELTQAAAGAGSWDWNISTGKMDWSSEMFELFGLDQSTTPASYEAWESVLHPDDAARAHANVDAALRTRSDLVNEYRIVRPDGAICWITALGRGSFDDEGQAYRLSGICLDITDRKQAEADLRRSEEKYRLLFQNMSEGFALYELLYGEDGRPVDWRILEVNDAYSRHTGVDREQIVGRRMSELFPAAIPEYLPGFAAVVDNQSHLDFQTYARAVGRHQHVVTFPAGEHRFASIIEDVTERKLAEEALRLSEAKFATVFHFSPDALCLIRTDDGGTILDANQAFADLLLHARSEVIGKRLEEVSPQHLTSELDRIADIFYQKGEVTGHELELQTASDGAATLLLSLAAVTIAGAPCVLFIAHDITRHKESEQALLRAQAELALELQERTALEERQRLARELHDSVSQALYGISLGVNTALAVLDTDRVKTLDALKYALGLAHAGLSEMRALIFSLRPESLEREGLVVGITKQAEAVHAHHGIDVELSLCGEPAVSLATKEALYRIAQEAMQNAVKHSQATRLQVVLACEQDGLRLEVQDDGTGFDAQATYPGHLGLHSMRERVLSVEGTLEVVSSQNAGTLIRASVPVRARPAAE